MPAPKVTWSTRHPIHQGAAWPSRDEAVEAPRPARSLARWVPICATNRFAVSIVDHGATWHQRPPSTQPPSWRGDPGNLAAALPSDQRSTSANVPWSMGAKSPGFCPCHDRMVAVGYRRLGNLASRYLGIRLTSNLVTRSRRGYPCLGDLASIPRGRLMSIPQGRWVPSSLDRGGPTELGGPRRPISAL